jgi:hypothetical protein
MENLLGLQTASNSPQQQWRQLQSVRLATWNLSKAMHVKCDNPAFSTGCQSAAATTDQALEQPIDAPFAKLAPRVEKSPTTALHDGTLSTVLHHSDHSCRPVQFSLLTLTLILDDCTERYASIQDQDRVEWHHSQYPQSPYALAMTCCNAKRPPTNQCSCRARASPSWPTLQYT